MVTPADRSLRAALTAAVTVPLAMIAYQVAGKAARDALFLSTFSPTALPAAVAGSAVLAIIGVVLSARIMTVLGPARMMPRLFILSAGFLLIEWGLTLRFRPLAASLVYLHFSALGALLISGFWSLVGERFDARTVKRQIGRIGAASTLGGVIGGVLAERVGVGVSITAILPVLAALQLFCAWAIRGLAPRDGPAARARPAGPMLEARSAFRLIAQRSYLRSLVGLVLLATVSEGLLDYVFKARAAMAAAQGDELIRLFAVFYTGVSVATFVLQSGFTRTTLERLGLARTVAALPGAVTAGGTAALLLPGLAATGLARAAEAVLRNSFYRSGYELLFTPLSPADRRRTKAVVDVAVVRLGDALGAGLVQVVLLAGPRIALTALLAVAVALSIGALALALGLHRGYVGALEKSLLARAVQLDLADVTDSTTRAALLHTAGAIDLTTLTGTAEPAPPAPPSEATPAESSRAGPVLDPDVRLVSDLRSGDVPRVRRALAQSGAPARWMVAHVIPLLAWDALAADAARTLRRAGPRAVGQMVDALLDPEEEFVIRRRLPAVLAACRSDRAVEGLVAGLEDSRFEVRYRCGRALTRLARAGLVPKLDPERVFRVALREVTVDRAIWESQRLLDQSDDDDPSPLVDDFLRERASRSLEHVFTVLSLVLPAQPLTIAFRGLHTDDPHLRGTALEYLESALPPELRARLWPFLEDTRSRPDVVRPREAILADLLRSNESIALNLAALRQRSEAEGSADRDRQGGSA